MERRSFFKLAGLSAAVLAVGGTLGACEAGKLPDNPLAATNKANETAGQSSVMGQPPIAFDADVDVLIVGSGVAGLSAPWIRSRRSAPLWWSRNLICWAAKATSRTALCASPARLRSRMRA